VDLRRFGTVLFFWMGFVICALDYVSFFSFSFLCVSRSNVLCNCSRFVPTG
jgi:hypothetical protein